MAILAENFKINLEKLQQVATDTDLTTQINANSSK